MRTIVDLPHEQLELLKQLSEQSRLSRADLMRRAVAEYLDRHGAHRGEEAFGVWRDAPKDALEYQRDQRGAWDA